MKKREKIIIVIAISLLIGLVLSFIYRPGVKIITVEKESYKWKLYYEMARNDYENLMSKYTFYQDSIKIEISLLAQRKAEDSISYIESIDRVMGMKTTELAEEFITYYKNDTGIVILPLRESGAINAIITKIKLDACKNSLQIREDEINLMTSVTISDKKLISDLREIIGEGGDKYATLLAYSEKLEVENGKLLADYEIMKVKHKRAKRQRNIAIGGFIIVTAAAIIAN